MHALIATLQIQCTCRQINLEDLTVKQAHEQSGHVPKLLWLARLDIQLAG